MGTHQDQGSQGYKGWIDRVVPILMTALCTGLALVPIALGAGEPGSEIQAPMATVIIFGLVSSTALNMLVVPAVYYAAHARRRCQFMAPTTGLCRRPGRS